MSTIKTKTFQIYVNYYIQNDLWDSISEPNLFVIPEPYSDLNEVKVKSIYEYFPLKDDNSYYLRFFLDDKKLKVKGWVDLHENSTVPVYNNGIVFVKALRLEKSKTSSNKVLGHSVFALNSSVSRQLSNDIYENQKENIKESQRSKVSVQNSNILKESNIQSKGSYIQGSMKKSVRNINNEGEGKNFLTPENIDFNIADSKVKETQNKTHSIKKNIQNFDNNDNNNDKDKEEGQNPQKETLNEENILDSLNKQENLKNTINLSEVVDKKKVEHSQISQIQMEKKYQSRMEANPFDLSNININNLIKMQLKESNKEPVKEPVKQSDIKQSVHSIDFPANQKEEIFIPSASVLSISKIANNQSEEKMEEEIIKTVTKWTYKRGIRKTLVELIASLHEMWKDTRWTKVSITELNKSKENLTNYYKKALKILHPDKNQKDTKTKLLSNCLFQVLSSSFVLIKDSL